MRIPTNPNAPPTFMRQYKIPIASYEPVQEIVDSMLEKGVIRPCNSTYSAPIWPVLKPNGKWRPTIDYRKLNQQVPLSRWPMTQLDQEIPKIKGSTILSTLDVASGVWTIPVHPKNYADIARPLTSLLKKDEPFVWKETQDTAMGQLIQLLCSAPCLAYPDPGK